MGAVRRTVAAAALISGAARAAAPNLVFNGTFEKVEKGAPAGWEAAGSGLVQTLAVDRGPDTAPADEVRERVEVHEVGPADQDEEGAGPHQEQPPTAQ